MSFVSSMLSVVWVTTASFCCGGNVSRATSSTVSTNVQCSGASPMVPSISGWPLWPMTIMLCPSFAYLITS